MTTEFRTREKQQEKNHERAISRADKLSSHRKSDRRIENNEDLRSVDENGRQAAQHGAG